MGVCFVRDGQLLTVRKRGTRMFMLVGGKIEPDESPTTAALREIREEVGLSLTAADLESLGQFSSPAANEPATWIDSTVFLAPALSAAQHNNDDAANPLPLTAQAEIAELRELDLAPQAVKEAEDTLAPLVRRQVLPLLRRRDSRFWSAHCGPLGPYTLETEPQS
ncbi:MAG: NUDIX domain-containing protein [Kocuria sp.]|nr:NUDIX domain-containing protein [Kocuria sp.]MDO5619518.1 NUDIX domain-containing protein [Kocuria sp.]